MTRAEKLADEIATALNLYGEARFYLDRAMPPLAEFLRTADYSAATAAFEVTCEKGDDYATEMVRP